jgi:polyisoprenoid-binding protein YceI
MLIHRAVLAAALALAPLPLCATPYTLEPDYTQGVFRWEHLGFSSPSAQFSQGQGTVEFDPSQPARSAVTVTIPLSSLHTGVPALDEDFHSTDFFDTGRYPAATFRSTQVEPGSTPDRLKVVGDLSLHGVTRPVTLDVTIIKIGTNPRTGLPTLGFGATAHLKRSDFGLGRYVPQVSDEISIQISAQAVEARAYAQYQKAQAEAAAAPAGR